MDTFLRDSRLPINSRIARTYTKIGTDVKSDLNAEEKLTKKCLRCPDAIVSKPHKQFTFQYKKDNEGNIVGVFRNNNCRMCERKKADSKDTVAILRDEIELLKRQLEEEKIRVIDLEKKSGENASIFRRAITGIVSHTKGISMKEDGTIEIESILSISK